MKTYHIHTLKELPKVASQFMKDFANFQVFAFYADMGVGKTTFIKAICEQLKVEDLVTSPTFAILNEYYTEKQALICHYDFYRIDKPEEIMRIGFEEYLDTADKIFIEWPEQVESLLPETYVSVIMETEVSGRRLLKVEIIN
ncbi:MAG: tRNA (adenosine(37)-N6)-threonylcarbamoyltransferase complex ATPase subunit type 1 TsaE [Bacteroidales bacterium]|jgi:tRNA threonylcarbamoyladenosine biosynthesis protein TsaE|nr:tRNA (adenosine(37)-N6)-threonylcarbamoyltransferase complex ATPase subunit type 1 TsaE [Bacteroidales bacterium]